MKIPTRVRAVVTGGASGLGRALCLELAKDKRARVVVADIDEVGAAETVAQVEAAGGEAVAIHCDVTVVADLEACADLCDERFGGVDLIANNAGVACAGRVGEVSLEDWAWITNINQWGVINGCHVFVPRLIASGGGFVINVASMAGFTALPEMAPYNVTKAAVIALSETLYTELEPHNITVTVVCPTFFATNLLKTFRSPSERQRKFAEKMFQRSTSSAEEVAADTLRGLEAKKPHVITQRDGKVAALLKRVAPRAYFRLLRSRQARVQ